MRLRLALMLIAALALGACSGSDAKACAYTRADGRSGYHWGWTAGTIVESNTIVDFDRSDPLQSYRPGYADGFVTGVGRWHGGLSSSGSTIGDYPTLLAISVVSEMGLLMDTPTP